MKWLLLAGLLFGAGGWLPGQAAARAAEGIKQPVFLICPHRKKYSSWSLSLTVDPADPRKVLALGLEELTRVNAEDLAPNGYDAALAAQRDPKTPRTLLGAMEAKDFAASELRIEKNNALHVGLAPLGPGEYRLYLSLRVEAEQRFIIGGKEKAKRDVVLRCDSATNTWAAYAVTLEDAAGKKVAAGTPMLITGICFPVTGTGIYRIAGMVGGDLVLLMDRDTSPENK